MRALKSRMTSSTLKSALVVGAVCLTAASSLVHAQLEPVRLYNGIGRSIPMQVDRPEGSQGDLSIRLLRPKSVEEGVYEEVAKAAAAEGTVDLSTMFPVLWTSNVHELLYAQLMVGADAIGSAVVLQPMVTPQRAHLMAERTTADPESGQQIVVPTITLDPREGRPMFEPEQDRLLRAAGRVPPEREVVFSGLRTYVDRHIVLDTTLGEITVMMRPDEAPNTVFNFRHLVEGGFYEDIIFHRIVPMIPRGPFVVQVGDPTGGGSGGAGYQIDLEPTGLPHDFGVISMARSSDPDTNGSQIFICLSRSGTQHLDNRYTAFGQMVGGTDVLLALAATPVDDQGRAEDPPVLRSAKLVPAPPIGTGPLPVTEPAAEPVGR